MGAFFARLVCLIFLLVPFVLRAAEDSRQLMFPCRDDDKACAARALAGHAVTKLDYWKRPLSQPVEQRMGSAPQELIEYLTLDNIKGGFPERPRPAKLADDFLREARAAVAELPASVRKRLSDPLAGIYFVDGLGGTGYTEEILDARSRPVAGFVVLDPSVLDKTANAWATWKESTPFKADTRFRLAAEIEGKAQDNRKNAIQYILLHELGHVLAIGRNFHPSWNVEPKDIGSAADYPFFRLSWSVAKADNRYTTVFDAAFPQRKDVVYYLGARLPAAQMAATYASLERTNFATLYSATSPGDDFAEAFASYVHTVLMRKPFEIRVYRDGKVVTIYRSCWTQHRCLEKKKILERFLRDPS